MSTLNELVAALRSTSEAVLVEASKVEVVSQSIIPSVKRGAVSTGDAAANTVAIRQTVAKYGRVDFPPGITMIDNDIRIASGNVLQGLGTPENPSILQAVPGSPAIAARNPAKAWYSLCQSNTDPGNLAALVGNTFGLPVGPSHGVTIRNLVLDGGFDDQLKDIAGRSLTTTEAVSLCGIGLVMEDCVIRNVAKGLSGGECFAVRVFAPTDRKYIGRPSRLSRIICGHVGNAGSTHPGAAGDEITLLSIVGSPNCTVESPIIEDCIVRGIKRGSVQPSPIHSLHTAYAYGADVRNNQVLDSDAVGYYQDTGTNVGLRIRGNLFRNVHRGVFLNAVTDFGAVDFEITDNTLQTYGFMPGWDVNSSPAGILFQKIASGGIGFVNGLIARNRIAALLGGFGTQKFYSRGVYLETREPKDVKNLVIRDNQTDVIQPPLGTYYPAWPGLMSLYATQAGFDEAFKNIRCWNNRDYAGAQYPMTLVDSGYIPRKTSLQL